MNAEKARRAVSSPCGDDQVPEVPKSRRRRCVMSILFVMGGSSPSPEKRDGDIGEKSSTIITSAEHISRASRKFRSLEVESLQICW